MTVTNLRAPRCAVGAGDRADADFAAIDLEMIGAGVFVAELEHQHHDWSFGQLALANVMLRQFPAKGFDDLKGVRSADGLASPFDQCNGVV
jgi:hypothetical protein